MGMVSAIYGNSFRMEGRKRKKFVWATGCRNQCAVDDMAGPVLCRVLQTSRAQGSSKGRSEEDHLHIRPLCEEEMKKNPHHYWEESGSERTQHEEARSTYHPAALPVKARVKS